MNETEKATCAFCEQEYEPQEGLSRSVLCTPCIDKNRQRVKRMGMVDNVYTHVHLALEATEKLWAAYPDSAALVEKPHNALLDIIVGIRLVRDQMHAQDRDLDKKLYEAHQRR